MAVKVCVGGTFNVLHEGHMALLARALAEGDELFVGLTSDEMAGRSRTVQVRGFDERREELASALRRMDAGKTFSIFPIEDEFGPAATGDFDVIVVSGETLPNAEKINLARQSNGLKPLRIVVIETVLDERGEPLSATRLLQSREPSG